MEDYSLKVTYKNFSLYNFPLSLQITTHIVHLNSEIIFDKVNAFDILTG